MPDSIATVRSSAARHLAKSLCLLGLVSWGILSVGCANRVVVREAPLRAAVVEFGDSVERAEEAYRQLAQKGYTEETVGEYNTAVAAVLDDLEKQLPVADGETVSIAGNGGACQFTVKAAAGVPWDLADFWALRPAEMLTIDGLHERIEKPGIGAPAVAQLAANPKATFAAPSGSYVPVTALIEFQGRKKATLTFHDPLLSDSVRILGRTQPLRSDLTAPLATTYAKRDRQIINLPALLNFEKFEEQTGIYRVDSIYPEKIPVVFVHGVKSNPDTWRDTINELRRDPVVRKRFEFWLFSYATGPPIPFSAMKFRESLHQMAERRRALGARNNDVILIGHSMGGLISRIMTQSSGDENWFQLFTKPVDQLDIPKSERELLRDMAYYEPVPFVKRVVFLSTPHGGSEFAEGAIGKLAADLIQLPSQLIRISRDLIRTSRYALTPEGRELLKALPTSVDTLRADSGMMQLFRGVPLNPAVTYHSIIGKDDDLVSYESAHVDGAVSEVLVEGDHGAHQGHEAIAELRRILRLHVGETD